MHALLTSIEERVQCLPEELPLYVTLITDNPSPELTSSFSNLWKEHIPGRAVPDDITVTGSFSLGGRMAGDSLGFQKQGDIVFKVRHI